MLNLAFFSLNNIDKKLSEYIKCYDDIFKAYKKKFSGFSHDSDIIEIEDKIDEIVYQYFEVVDIERDLIDFAFEISIPIFNNRDEPFEPIRNNPEGFEILEKYANVFVEHFENTEEKYFDEYLIIEPYISPKNNILAMNFKFIKEEPKRFIKDPIINDNISEILEIISNISFESICDGLYIQKDIKGFEENSFYVIKTNERKNWHRAIAWLDLYEFLDAMMKTGIEQLSETK